MIALIHNGRVQLLCEVLKKEGSVLHLMVVNGAWDLKFNTDNCMGAWKCRDKPESHKFEGYLCVPDWVRGDYNEVINRINRLLGLPRVMYRPLLALQRMWYALCNQLHRRKHAIKEAWVAYRRSMKGNSIPW